MLEKKGLTSFDPENKKLSWKFSKKAKGAAHSYAFADVNSLYIQYSRMRKPNALASAFEMLRLKGGWLDKIGYSPGVPALDYGQRSLT